MIKRGKEVNGKYNDDEHEKIATLNAEKIDHRINKKARRQEWHATGEWARNGPGIREAERERMVGAFES